MNFGTGDFSIDAWIKLGSGPGSIHPIVDKLDFTAPGLNRGYALFVQGGQLLIRLGPANFGGLVAAASTFPTPIAPGEWHFIAVTVERTPSKPLVTFYLDGVPDGPHFTAGPDLDASINLDSTTPLWIGGNSRLAGGGATVSRGEICIDELEFFHLQIAPQTVQDIYLAGPAGKCKSGCQGGVQCPTDKTVPCGVAWTFDLPFSLDPNCVNFQLTVLSTITNSLAPCAAQAIRTWQITDCCSNITHCTQTVLIGTAAPPVVVSAPVSQTIYCACTVCFMVEAGGTPPFTYQWYHNGTVIPGATNPLFSIFQTQPADAGNYSVTICNPFGCVSSPAATLTVAKPDYDVAVFGGALPDATMADHGTNLLLLYTFAVTNKGPQIAQGVTATCLAPQVQVSILGAWPERGGSTGTGDSLTCELGTMLPGEVIPVVVLLEATNFGYRSVESIQFQVMTSAVGNDTAPADNPLARSWFPVFTPLFSTQPADQEVLPGGSATFSATLWLGCATPLAYQWQFNGVPLPGATTPTLTVPGVTLAHYGQYSVRVTNPFGEATSATARLWGGPGFAPNLRVTLTLPPSPIVVEGEVTLLATVENLGGDATGVALQADFPAGFQILETGVSQGAMLATNSTSLQADLGALPSAAQAVLTLVGNVPGAGSFAFAASATSTPPDSNLADNSDQGTVLTGDLPVIIQQPLDQAVPVFGPASFSVSATGNPIFGYQWRLNGEAIPNAGIAQ